MLQLNKGKAKIMLAVVSSILALTIGGTASAHPHSHCILEGKTYEFVLLSKTEGEYPAITRSAVSISEKGVELLHVSTASFGEIIHAVTVAVNGHVIRSERIRQWSNEIGMPISFQNQIEEEGSTLSCTLFSE